MTLKTMNVTLAMLGSVLLLSSLEVRADDPVPTIPELTCKVSEAKVRVIPGLRYTVQGVLNPTPQTTVLEAAGTGRLNPDFEWQAIYAFGNGNRNPIVQIKSGDFSTTIRGENGRTSAELSNERKGESLSVECEVL